MGDSFQFVCGLNSRDFIHFAEDDSDKILGGPLDEILVYGNQLLQRRHSNGAPDRLAAFYSRNKRKIVLFMHQELIFCRLPPSTVKFYTLVLRYDSGVWEAFKEIDLIPT